MTGIHEAVSEPIPFATTRFRCPYCRRTASSKTRMRVHMDRCLRNPSVRSCKTCRYADRAESGYGQVGYVDYCNRGVDLSTPSCAVCGNTELKDDPMGAFCPEHFGRPLLGMRVQCDKWEAPPCL